VAVTLAFIGTNLMEIVSPHGRGLGALFDSGRTNSDFPLMFAVLIALAFLGIVLYYIVVALGENLRGLGRTQSGLSKPVFHLGLNIHGGAGAVSPRFFFTCHKAQSPPFGRSYGMIPTHPRPVWNKIHQMACVNA
jgi:hypothetical protein